MPVQVSLAALMVAIGGMILLPSVTSYLLLAYRLEDAVPREPKEAEARMPLGRLRAPTERSQGTSRRHGDGEPTPADEGLAAVLHDPEPEGDGARDVGVPVAPGGQPSREGDQGDEPDEREWDARNW